MTLSQNDDEQLQPNADLDREATTWVVRLTSGEATPDDEDAFRRWRDQSPLHGEALARARRLWLQMSLAFEREFALVCPHCGAACTGHATVGRTS